MDQTESIEGEGARGYVTVTLYGGFDPELHQAFVEKSSVKVWAVEPTLRSYENDEKPGRIVDLVRHADPPFGSSGIQLRILMDEMLEGFRPGRSVRIAAGEWKTPVRPREERLWPQDVRVFSVGPQGVAGREP